MAWTSGQILAQSLVSVSAPIGDRCVELNQTVMTQIANGKLKEAELALSAFLTSGADRGREACAGLVLNNMAALMSISGRLGDGKIGGAVCPGSGEGLSPGRSCALSSTSDSRG